MEDAYTRLKTILANMAIVNNYWGYIFSRISKREEKNLESIMGVSVTKQGKFELLYNPDLFEGTEDKTIYKVLEHEGVHLLFKHLQRSIRLSLINNISNESDEKMYAHNKIFNIAADICVNEAINAPDEFIINNKSFKLVHAKHYGLENGFSTEYYYNKLINSKLLKQILDSYSIFIEIHKRWNELTKDNPDVLSSLSKAEDNLNELIKNATSHCREMGTIPGNLKELIDNFLKQTETPYFQIIQKIVIGSRNIKQRRSTNRVNKKRGWILKEEDQTISLFPGKVSDKTFKIVVLIDTSGSQGAEDIAEALGGIKNIIENDKDCETTVIECDTKVQKEYKVKKIKDIQPNVAGRGGTILLTGLQRAKELKADCCLAFSDGWTENFESVSKLLLPKKLIWCINTKKGGTFKNVRSSGFCIDVNY